MKQSITKRIARSVMNCLVALALVGLGFWIMAGQTTKDAKAALPAEQVIEAIKTAITAKPGNVRAVEAEYEGDKLICEVEILAADGKIYEVEVDIATNTVIEIEEDDDHN